MSTRKTKSSLGGLADQLCRPVRLGFHPLVRKRRPRPKHRRTIEEEVQDTGFLSSLWNLTVQRIGSAALREQMADLAGTDERHRDEQAACGRGLELCGACVL